MNDLNEQNAVKFNLASSIRHELQRGPIRDVLSFSRQQVEMHKQARTTKTATLQKKLEKQVEEYTKNRPIVMETKKKERELEQIRLFYDKLVVEKEARRQEVNAKRQLGKLMLEGNISEMAEHIQRYRSVYDKLKNPNKKAEKSAPSKLMAMMNKFRLRKPAQSLPESSRKEVPDQVIPTETSRPSKHQELDTNEVSEAFKRGSAARIGIRKRFDEKTNPRNEVVGKPSPPKIQKVSKAPPSFIQKNVDHKQKGTSEQPAKQAMSRESATKATTESTDSLQKSQKSKKGKVTFVDLESSGSGFEMDFSKENGISSTNFKNSATNDIDMELSLENENEIQMNDGDEVNRQMDDGENGENNCDQDFEEHYRDFCASPEDGAGIHSSETDFDAEFSSGMFRTSDSEPQADPTSNCDFDMNFMDDEIEEMNSLFP